MVHVILVIITVDHGHRFQEVARLVAVFWFEIRGKINTLALSSHTHCAIFLVLKLINPYGFHYLPTELSVGVTGGQSCTKEVCLDPNLEYLQITN